MAKQAIKLFLLTEQKLDTKRKKKQKRIGVSNISINLIYTYTPLLHFPFIVHKSFFLNVGLRSRIPYVHRETGNNPSCR